jgi:hypothetical protein
LDFFAYRRKWAANADRQVRRVAVFFGAHFFGIQVKQAASIEVQGYAWSRRVSMNSTITCTVPDKTRMPCHANRGSRPPDIAMIAPKLSPLY